MKKLLVTSFVKEELLAAAGCTSVSSAALDWLQAETEKLVAYVAAQGKKTAGGKLQPPDAAYPVTQGGPQGSRGDKDFPEKVCWRVKEWRNTPPEAKTRHLTEIFASWFALNTDEKLEALHKLYVLAPEAAPSEEAEEAAPAATSGPASVESKGVRNPRTRRKTNDDGMSGL